MRVDVANNLIRSAVEQELGDEWGEHHERVMNKVEKYVFDCGGWRAAADEMKKDNLQILSATLYRIADATDRTKEMIEEEERRKREAIEQAEKSEQLELF